MKTMRRVLFGVVLGILLLPSADLAAQRPRRAAARVDPMTSSIKGLVTAADTGAPVRGAEVRLSSRGSYNRLVTTDGDGAYRLSDLPAGEYRLTVSRTGYTSLVFGQRRPLEAPTTIDLSEGETFTRQSRAHSWRCDSWARDRPVRRSDRRHTRAGAAFAHGARAASPAEHGPGGSNRRYG